MEENLAVSFTTHMWDGLTQILYEQICCSKDAHWSIIYKTKKLWAIYISIYRGIKKIQYIYAKKQTKKTSNNLTLNLKQPEKSKISRRKEIIMIRAEINETETKKIIEKINEK